MTERNAPCCSSTRVPLPRCAASVSFTLDRYDPQRGLSESGPAGAALRDGGSAR
jgi:hypothetical protein